MGWNNNYRGNFLQQLERLDDAIDAYQIAVHLDPKLDAVQENLCGARLQKEYPEMDPTASGPPLRLPGGSDDQSRLDPLDGFNGGVRGPRARRGPQIDANIFRVP
jgi:hypothetical protein